MIDLLPLLSKTNAYKSIEGDINSGRLSHAYLIVSANGDDLKEFLKLFAKLIVAKGNERALNLIDNGTHPDVLSFPTVGDAILKEDVARIIDESFLKPIEGDIKLFLLNNGESMNASSQNKLLKTLEEPPKGVHILIGATSEYPILTTVKSRVKKLVIPSFSKDSLFGALKPVCEDGERLKNAVACGDGTVGKALALYGDENLSQTIEAVVDTLCNMQTSRNVLEYSDKIIKLKDGVSGFLSVLETVNRDMMLYFNGNLKAVFDAAILNRVKTAKGFTAGAVLHIADKITEAQKRLAANGTPQAVLEWLLFAILEGKHKWQKL